MMPTTPSGWYSMRERPPAGSTGTPSGALHLSSICAGVLACFIGAIEAPMSVSRVISWADS